MIGKVEEAREGGGGGGGGGGGDVCTPQIPHRKIGLG